MKALGNTEKVSKGLGIISIKKIVAKEKERLLKDKPKEYEQRLKQLK